MQNLLQVFTPIVLHFTVDNKQRLTHVTIDNDQTCSVEFQTLGNVLGHKRKV